MVVISGLRSAQSSTRHQANDSCREQNNRCGFWDVVPGDGLACFPDVERLRIYLPGQAGILARRVQALRGKRFRQAHRPRGKRSVRAPGTLWHRKEFRNSAIRRLFGCAQVLPVRRQDGGIGKLISRRCDRRLKLPSCENRTLRANGVRPGARSGEDEPGACPPVDGTRQSAVTHQVIPRSNLAHGQRQTLTIPALQLNATSRHSILIIFDPTGYLSSRLVSETQGNTPVFAKGVAKCADSSLFVIIRRVLGGGRPAGKPTRRRIHRAPAKRV